MNVVFVSAGSAAVWVETNGSDGSKPSSLRPTGRKDPFRDAVLLMSDSMRLPSG